MEVWSMVRCRGGLEERGYQKENVGVLSVPLQSRLDPTMPCLQGTRPLYVPQLLLSFSIALPLFSFLHPAVSVQHSVHYCFIDCTPVLGGVRRKVYERDDDKQVDVFTGGVGKPQWQYVIRN